MSSISLIAFSGKPRAGKDVAANHLCAHGYTKVQIAQPLYRICEHLQKIFGRKVEKDRNLLHSVGEKMKILRHPDVWINIATSAIIAVGNKIVVSDCRFLNEYERIKALGGKIVRIIRDTETSDSVFNDHHCESELDSVKFDAIIYNNGTLEEFIEKIDAVIIN